MTEILSQGDEANPIIGAEFIAIDPDPSRDSRSERILRLTINQAFRLFHQFDSLRTR